MNALLIRLEQILDQLHKNDVLIDRGLVAEGRSIIEQLRAMAEAA